MFTRDPRRSYDQLSFEYGSIVNSVYARISFPDRKISYSEPSFQVSAQGSNFQDLSARKTLGNFPG